MHDDDLQDWEHSHTFGQDVRRPGERRTLLVIAITATMMVVEIVAGLAFSSMALLADGLHMASHTAALGITAFAYVYARRHAHDPRFTFGTGKVNALAGFSGAVLLATFAVLMAAGEHRTAHRPGDDRRMTTRSSSPSWGWPSTASPSSSSASTTRSRHDDDHDQTAIRQGATAHDGESTTTTTISGRRTCTCWPTRSRRCWPSSPFSPPSTWASTWMDPVMGIVGAVLVARWSVGLLRATSGVLLDRRGPSRLREPITERVEADGDSRIADLHLWSIGPGIYAAEVAIVAHAPATPDEYKRG